MARKWIQWTTAQAHQVLGDLDASGLSVEEFSRRKGLHPGRVRRWRSRLFGKEPEAGIRLVELVSRRAAEQAGLRIHCPSGHVIEVAEVDLASGLEAVLAVLAKVSEC